MSFALLALGCSGLEPPELMGDDGGRGGAADAGPLSLERLEIPTLGGLFPAAPLPPASDGWTAPPQCPSSTDDAHCAACWASRGGGPRSLDRNEVADEFGAAVAVGDLNGDGYPDLAVGAPGEDVGAVVGAGQVYVFLGSVQGFQPWKVVTDAGNGGPFAGAGFGASLVVADFDGIGAAELVVGYRGPLTNTPILVFEGDGTLAFDFALALSDLDPDGSVQADSELGASMVVDDLNGDGKIDLAVGAPNYFSEAVEDYTGAVFVVENMAGALTGGLSLVGHYEGERFGQALATGDVGSGSVSLVVGAPGKARVDVYDWDTKVDDFTSDLGLPSFGTSLAVGDLDLDGTAEILVGGLVKPSVELAGAATAFTPVTEIEEFAEVRALAVVDLDGEDGPDVGILVIPKTGEDYEVHFHLADGSAWFQLTGPVPSDARFGSSLAVADIDGDWNPDLVVGASAPSSDAGEVHSYVAENRAVDWDSELAPRDSVTQESELSECDLCMVYGHPDGYVCDAVETGSSICVFGTCVLRGCGDGYRQTGAEPGMNWPRESCDDGNTIDADACTACTTSNRVIVSSRSDGDDSPSRFAPAVAEDGNRNLLFVYAADMGDVRELRARRANYGGALDASAVVLATLTGPGWDPEASVAGLRDGGWAVTWTDHDAEGSGIALMGVAEDGTPSGGVLWANQETRDAQFEPRVAALADGGLVVVWTDAGGFAGSLGGGVVKARRYSNMGVQLEDEWLVSDPSTSGSQPAIAAIGDEFVIAWTEDPGLDFGMPAVWAQRFGGATPDAAPFEVSESGSAGAEPALAVLGTGYVAAWTRRDPTYDFRGDIQTRTIAASGDPLASSVVTPFGLATVADGAPSIAALNASEYVVSYEVGGHRRGLAYGHNIMSLPSESSQLPGYFSGGLQGDVSLLSTFRGVWFAWSDANPPAPATSGALRAFLAFLLPGS